MVTFDPKEMLGIVHLRSLGYYKIKKVSYSKILAVCIILNQLIRSMISSTD